MQKKKKITRYAKKQEIQLQIEKSIEETQKMTYDRMCEQRLKQLKI